MKKKIIVDLIWLIMWNAFIFIMATSHVAPHFVIWMGGVGTGGFIGLFYMTYPREN